MALAMPQGIVFDAAGLVPVVAQDRASGDVLMVAWANAEAVAQTAETGIAHFWSRSRKAALEEGRDLGERAARRRSPGRLRQGHAAPRRRADRARLPHG